MYFKNLIYLCKQNKKWPFWPLFIIISSNEGSNQTSYGVSAHLSSIFNGRTRPTLNVVEALKKKIPDINTDWLMFGSGKMYQNTAENSSPTPSASENGIFDQSPMLDFEQNSPAVPQNLGQMTQNSAIINKSRPEIVREDIKILDKPQRKVMEIRVFYDDQTWDTFLPVKK